MSLNWTGGFDVFLSSLDVLVFMGVVLGLFDLAGQASDDAEHRPVTAFHIAFRDQILEPDPFLARLFGGGQRDRPVAGALSVRFHAGP
jgi:hypothetical protein